jgi:hypothetical protein
MRGKSGVFNLALNVTARTETGINKLFMPQLLQSLRIIFAMATLVADNALPANAKPVEIINQIGCILRAAAVEIDVLDA